MIRLLFLFFFLACVCTSCDTDNIITLRSVDSLSLEFDEEFNPVLKVKISFYNSSSYTLHLKKLYLDIFIDDKKLAIVDEKLDVTIASKSDFSIPMKVKLTLEEKGLLGKLIAVLAGRHYTVVCAGQATVSFWGIPIHVPIHYTKDQF